MVMDAVILSSPSLIADKRQRLFQAELPPKSVVSDALKHMNQTGFRAVLVVDDNGQLAGIVTDFDIRTALLDGMTLDTPLALMMNTRPVLGIDGMPAHVYRDQMMAHGIECLPVVDRDRHIKDFVFLKDFVDIDPVIDSAMVIMAGGAGKRLWPLTKDTPKPLLPVADKPLLEHILQHARSQGFQEVCVSTHYKSEQIEAFLQTSTPEGMETTVLREESPLGTAGCLKTFYQAHTGKPIFIMNGDILTTLDFRAMLDWHITHGNILTVACRQYVHQIPYGVLQNEGQRLISIQEKPTYCCHMNAGIYLVEPAALESIPDNIHFDMPDLIEVLLSAGHPVGTFPISEPWIDIGHHADYERVNEEHETFLPEGAVC
jgi:dTDP-glucose pyrophosphorylase